MVPEIIFVSLSLFVSLGRVIFNKNYCLSCPEPKYLQLFRSFLGIISTYGISNSISIFSNSSIFSILKKCSVIFYIIFANKKNQNKLSNNLCEWNITLINEHILKDEKWRSEWNDKRMEDMFKNIFHPTIQITSTIKYNCRYCLGFKSK